MTFFGTFLFKKQQKWAISKSFLGIGLNVVRKTHFLVLWKQSSRSYSHFNTFRPKNGNIYDLTLVPHPMLIKFYFSIFWRYSCSYLSYKILATFLAYLIPYLQPDVPVTQLWYPLCTCLLNPSLFVNPSLFFI